MTQCCSIGSFLAGYQLSVCGDHIHPDHELLHLSDSKVQLEFIARGMCCMEQFCQILTFYNF